MKKLILTFFIIILCVIILSRKEDFRGITERNSNQKEAHLIVPKNELHACHH